MPKLPSPTSKKIRQAIIDTCLEMNDTGINQGTSGNVSARVEGGMLITPSGRPYKTMKPKDIVFMHEDGSYEGDLVPSTEWRFHLDIMNSRDDVNAIVHAHPTFCTVIAILKKNIPRLHYMVAVAGGDDIRCAPYATFGTQALSDNAIKALKDRKACLLAHHGMIATGPDLAKAMWLAVEVETPGQTILLYAPGRRPTAALEGGNQERCGAHPQLWTAVGGGRRRLKSPPPRRPAAGGLTCDEFSWGNARARSGCPGFGSALRPDRPTYPWPAGS